MAIVPSCAAPPAGVAADGLSLLERLEQKLEEHPGAAGRWVLMADACCCCV